MPIKVLMPYSLDPAIAHKAAEAILNGAAPSKTEIRRWLQEQNDPGRSAMQLRRNLIKDFNELTSPYRPSSEIHITIVFADGELFRLNVNAVIVAVLETKRTKPACEEKATRSAKTASAKGVTSAFPIDQYSSLVDEFLKNLSKAVYLEFSHIKEKVFEYMGSPSSMIHWNQFTSCAPQPYDTMMYAGSADLWKNGVTPLAALISDAKKSDIGLAGDLEKILNDHILKRLKLEKDDIDKLNLNLTNSLVEKGIIPEGDCNRSIIDSIMRAVTTAAQKYLKIKVTNHSNEGIKSHPSACAEAKESKSNEGYNTALLWSLRYICHELATFATHMKEKKVEFIQGNKSRNPKLSSTAINCIEEIELLESMKFQHVQQSAASSGSRVRNSKKPHCLPSGSKRTSLLEEICRGNIYLADNGRLQIRNVPALREDRQRQQYRRNWITRPTELQATVSIVTQIIDRRLPALLSSPDICDQFAVFLASIDKPTILGELPVATGFAHNINEAWSRDTRLVLLNLKIVTEFFDNINTPIPPKPFSVQSLDKTVLPPEPSLLQQPVKLKEFPFSLTHFYFTTKGTLKGRLSETLIKAQE